MKRREERCGIPRDLRPSRFSDRLPLMSDLESLSKTLSVSPGLVRNMMPLVGIQRGSTVGGIRIERGPDDSIRVWTDVHGTLAGLDLQRQLSNTAPSEKGYRRLRKSMTRPIHSLSKLFAAQSTRENSRDTLGGITSEDCCNLKKYPRSFRGTRHERTRRT